jgi:hypothetical protein
MKQFGFGGTDLVRCLQKFAAVHYSVHNHFNQKRHFYSRDNFKLNRTAALTEWRQLLRAEVQAAPAIRCEFSSV